MEREKKNFFGRFFFIADSVRSYIRAARIRGQNGGVEIFQKSFSSDFLSPGVDLFAVDLLGRAASKKGHRWAIQ